MRWLFFVLSALCFAVAFRTHSVGLAAIAMLLALGLLLAGVFAIASHRVQSRARDEVHILSPEELRRMREQAAQNRAAGTAGPALPQTPAGNADTDALPPR
jgi:hypothetical protein